MSQGHKPQARRRSKLAAAAWLALAAPIAGQAADTDIYGPTGSGTEPNVVFLLDNTSNWSSNNQNWNSGDSWKRCESLAEPAKTQCKNLIDAIYYDGIPTSGNGAKKRPWDDGYDNNANKDGVHPTQGQLQLRALKLVLNSLVCSGSATALKINVGLSLIDKKSTLNDGHPVGIINFAVQPLTGTAMTAGSSCKAIIDRLNTIDSQITSSTYKAPADANYGAAMYEIFKYFGGHSNPTLAGNAPPNGGSPVGATGYGPIRFSSANPLDDVNAFTTGAKTTYKSPLSGANSCGNNYVVLVGNTYPNAEPGNGGPVRFSGLNYTPPTLSPVSSDTRRYADEWAYFLANTDISEIDGVQRMFTYTVNTYNAKPDADQAKLLKSMAAQGGIGSAGYLEVGGDLVKLVETFKDILLNIAAVNSVFTATTLPVSTTTQGTFLNQIFVGKFRPDANAGPRWVGNLKQYQLGMVNGVLDLVDKNGKPAVLAGAGFFSPLAESFWTEDSVFFDASPSGTPPSASDRPDGPIVEKGGAAQQLRRVYAQGAASRNVKVLVGSTLQDLPGNAAFSPFTLDEVKWIRGENNVATGPGAELFNGSYLNAGTTTSLGSTGARHSIHGDVLHSRPVALNYGSGDVVVYYGTNDGFFRAVDGNKTGDRAGQELWSFIAPEHYGLITRLRSGAPTIHLPETNSGGGTIAAPSGSSPKSYGMDGPIGVYARYSSGGGSVSEAIVYPTMRRGGQSVYAFDVSSKAAPSVKWKIDGGSGDYAKLAQTWSMPKPVVLSNSTVSAPILLMGGGYDASEDTNNFSGVGNVVYVINGFTGARIAALATDYSVPSDVAVVDVNGDGEPDRAYVADVRGHLYRIDFPTSGDLLLTTTWSAVSAVKIASLGGKVFFTPDVVVTKDFVAVLVGTGDREKPLLVSTSDNFFLIKDNIGAPRATALVKGDLTRVAKIDNTTMAPTSPSPAPNDPEGCYLELATNGEKVVNAPFTIAGATYFGTNRPKPANSTTCSADLGEAYVYKFPLFCGVPAKPNTIVGGGLPPSPVGGIVNMTVDGKEVKMPFIIGSGEGNSSFKVAQPNWPIPPVRSRLNWRIDNTNR